MTDQQFIDEVLGALNTQDRSVALAAIKEMTNDVHLISVRDGNLVVANMKVADAERIVAVLERGIGNAQLSFQ